MKPWRMLAWVGTNLLLWAAATLAFALWIDHTVREEYRLGYRTSTDGDTIAIPIAGFALALGVVLLAANAALLVVTLIRRRRG